MEYTGRPFFSLENISLPQAAVTANIPAGAGAGRHHSAGWLGLPGRLQPFPSQGAIPLPFPRDPGPAAQRLFMLPALGVVFARGKRGAGVAPWEYPGEPWPLRVPSAHREKGRIVKNHLGSRAGKSKLWL